ncbi:glycosyltransferase family 4 protein [Ramlibacter algicola]|uniref:Glycosyltransferase family 4 protein n=1 Tax=Ramlibacter algicola TaxID=2795217 RepID=A0A934UQC6_9BURK|nr:glycosyltransferase family 4 protein [Ramlibacter algicola]MBK0391975.1 glycosyltransferase family 4 protein [Ramlibacter algicola]
MRILIVHNKYQQRGGEDVVVESEAALLREAGHELELFSTDNNVLMGAFAKLVSAVGVVFSIPVYIRIRRILRTFKPDVVHVHNFFPQISPSVFYACSANKVPVVFTLHNFRIICPTALLMHDGRIEEKSVIDGPWWAVAKRVYRGSFSASLLLALMIYVHRRIGTWKKKVSVFIALTEFSALKFQAWGLPADKLTCKPNFVLRRSKSQISQQRRGFLFAGRLSEEKGIDVMLKAAKEFRGEEIRVAGDGPLVADVSSSGLTHLGRIGSEELAEEMLRARALVLPSLWFEGLPMVLVEAYSLGLPIIASNLGSLATLVEHGVTGLLFVAGDAEDLASKLRWATENPVAMERMGENARAKYEREFSPERNLILLERIYVRAISATATAGSEI